ncbi:MAG: helix-hairpin-helix domain-containing protein [Clostridia bacterium]|nr:helix-hairpin-helix domain-containing protein [Clostridia bacterium]
MSRINLSSILKDEQKIIVPYKVIEQKDIDSSNKIQKNKTTLNNASQININYASQTELEKLTGIGPAMAGRIISYREENGLFHSIEDVKNVSRNW